MIEKLWNMQFVNIVLKEFLARLFKEYERYTTHPGVRVQVSGMAQTFMVHIWKLWPIYEL